MLPSAIWTWEWDKMGKKRRKKSKGSGQRKVQNVRTPTQSHKQLPKTEQSLKDYKRALVKKSKEVEALRDRLTKTEKGLQALHQKTKDSSSDIADLQAKTSDLQARNTDLENRNEDLQSENDELLQKVQYYEAIDGQGGDIVSHLRQVAKDNRENLAREREDFRSYKRRARQQRETSHREGKLEILQELLKTIEDLDRAALSRPNHIQEDSWSTGVRLVHRELEQLLQKNDVTAIDPIAGEPFDPNDHECVAVVDCDENESERILETIQKGYKAGDTLLRAALVKVAR